MRGPAVELTEDQRRIVAATIQEVAAHRRWGIHTVNVRTNHVHVVVTAPGQLPEKVMNDFKAWATRRLREAGMAGAGALWSRHGSTPHLYSEAALAEAVHYVSQLQ